ncbi:hypothetical protein SHM7688_02003 [Shimia marina]|uniref:Uncharacterized protein n=1 Tax=Shimia marina TaxID=321267 RepID=A0A0N7LS40_9RHOB|nr:hypothetical protein SHM7688_02003 [Shimia marina]
MGRAKEGQPETPEQRRDQKLADGAEKENLKSQKLAQAQFSEQLVGRPHVDEVGGHVALEPA